MRMWGGIMQIDSLFYENVMMRYWIDNLSYENMMLCYWIDSLL